MNILHMKYAVEVAKFGSINRAADALYVAQPSLSRSIKELETELGIVIFDRSAKGMNLTPEGEEFIGYATNVLSQIHDIERMYQGKLPRKKRFSISVPRASYISDAFTRFCSKLGDEPMEIFYKETNAYRAIQNIINSDYKLGIIRYAAHFDQYFKASLEEKELLHELISEFVYVLVMHKESPLASKREIHFNDLTDLIEIAHGDPFVPSLSTARVRKEELPDNISRRIFVFERGSQFDLLSSNKNTFMWVSPLPTYLLERYGLIQAPCADNNKVYKDVLIRKKNYVLSEFDKRFIDEIAVSKKDSRI
ncbi:MAG: LysR family transcriptional regulator [Clostridiales bacterium]|nr:LysR family transcriptional regulator [Clostridiales bacterium]